MKDKVEIFLDEKYVRQIKNNLLSREAIILAGQILCQVIKDIQNKRKHSRTVKNKEEAKIWLNSNEDNYLFDFINICRLFDINPGKTRIEIAKREIKLPNLYVAYTSGRKREE